MEISPEKRREIISALRKGTVPQRGLDFLAVGLSPFEGTIKSELSDVAEGGSIFKAVRGEYGCGKTFFGRWIQEQAKQNGFATAEVQISETETPLHKLETVSQRPQKVVWPKGRSDEKPDVQLDFVGSLANAAKVISLLHQGEKRLVFCDSRSRVEQLAVSLRSYGVDTFVSHSSVGLDERRQAEEAFAQRQNCVIVATSSLELGLDVGDLDRVIQIDAPGTVSSFLQRMGRTGRRSNTTRNCLFLATSDEGLLRAAALIELWRRGYIEPVIAPRCPYHILAQQLMALILQERGVGLYIATIVPSPVRTERTWFRSRIHVLQERR